MKCIKCNSEIEQDAQFCIYCGARQQQDNVDQSLVDDQEKSKKNRKPLWAAIIFISLLVVGGGLYLGFNSLIDHPITEEDLLFLKDVQKQNGAEGIRVKLFIDSDDGEQTLKVYRNVIFLQEFEKAWYAGGGGQDNEDAIHLVDYNFDGCLDILYGPACDRTVNTLYIWDKKQDKFVMSGKIGEVQAQTPLLSYKEKAIYTTGTGGRGIEWWSKSKWVDGELKDIEHLSYLDDFWLENQDSDEEKVNTHYTLKDSLNNRIIEVNTVEELPQNWQIVISKYEKQWEAERIEEEKRMKEREKEFEQSLKQQLFDNISSRHPGLVKSPNDIHFLKKKENGTYQAQFTDRGEYEHIDYIIDDIQIENNEVVGFALDVLHIRPTEKKHSPGMTQQEYYEMKLREGRHYGL